MVRPCFLVIDREYAGSISTRKLVIETAKLNVLTAYSGSEALETLGKYPRVDGIVLDAGVADIPCVELIRRFKQMQPDLPVVLIATPGRTACEGADHVLDGFEPGKMLSFLGKLVPGARELMQREQREIERGTQ